MKQSGITVDNIPTFKSMFKYVGTHGIPLEIVLMFMQKHNMVMDWMEYIKDALKDGHKPRTIRARIISAVGEIYGPIYRDEVTKRLDLILLTSS